MADGSTKRVIVDGVDFSHILQFPKVLRSVTAAMQPPRLVLGLLIVVLLGAPGRLWDGMRKAEIAPGGLLAEPWSYEAQAELQDILVSALDAYVDPADQPSSTGRVRASSALRSIEAGYRAQRAAVSVDAGDETAVAEQRRRDEVFEAVCAEIESHAPLGAFEATLLQLGRSVQRLARGVLKLRPTEVYGAVGDVAVRVPRALWQRERAFAIIFGLIALVVVSLGGVALCRMAACDFAGHERLRVWDAIDFAFGNLVRVVLTPVLPMVLAGVGAVLLILFGLLLLPVLDLVGGLLYGLAILVGFLLAFILIGYAIGLPLLLPAVACENCDPADAFQRSYAYVLNRPVHLLGYVIVAAFGLALGYVVVATFATTALNLTGGLVRVIGGSSGALSAAGGFGVFDLVPAAPSTVEAAWHDRMAGAGVAFWQGVVVQLVGAYLVSYAFTSATLIYLQMRRLCDGQDPRDIWRPGMLPGTRVPVPASPV